LYAEKRGFVKEGTYAAFLSFEKIAPKAVPVYPVPDCSDGGRRTARTTRPTMIAN